MFTKYSYFKFKYFSQNDKDVHPAINIILKIGRVLTLLAILCLNHLYTYVSGPIVFFNNNTITTYYGEIQASYEKPKNILKNLINGKLIKDHLEF